MLLNIIKKPSLVHYRITISIFYHESIKVILLTNNSLTTDSPKSIEARIYSSNQLSYLLLNLSHTNELPTIQLHQIQISPF